MPIGTRQSRRRGVRLADLVEIGNRLVAVTCADAALVGRPGCSTRNRQLWAASSDAAGTSTPSGFRYVRWQAFRDFWRMHSSVRLCLLPGSSPRPLWFMKDQHMNLIRSDALIDCGAAQVGLSHHSRSAHREAIELPGIARGARWRSRSRASALFAQAGSGWLRFKNDCAGLERQVMPTVMAALFALARLARGRGHLPAIPVWKAAARAPREISGRRSDTAAFA